MKKVVGAMPVVSLALWISPLLTETVCLSGTKLPDP